MPTPFAVATCFTSWVLSIRFYRYASKSPAHAWRPQSLDEEQTPILSRNLLINQLASTTFLRGCQHSCDPGWWGHTVRPAWIEGQWRNLRPFEAQNGESRWSGASPEQRWDTSGAQAGQDWRPPWCWAHWWALGGVVGERRGRLPVTTPAAVRRGRPAGRPLHLMFWAPPRPGASHRATPPRWPAAGRGPPAMRPAPHRRTRPGAAGRGPGRR